MCAGIKAVVDLVEEINDGLGRQQIRVIDIGGGLPVNFAGESTEPTFEAYSQTLRSEVPQLFDESNNYTVITEFGRALLAKSGITVAKVEYTKTSGGQKIAITHAGAQVLLRTVMSPKDWMRRVSAFDSGGRPRTTNDVVQDVAGPCCFSGDVIAHRRLLPLIEVGDYIAVHDTGAYCFSAPFAYNGLPTPPVYRLIVSEESDIRFDKIGGGQSVSNLIAHFS
jgi:diaminopimelate decarboxylase